MEEETMSENTYPTLYSPDLPAKAKKSCMRPPDRAVRVECYDCGQRFSSDEMVWRFGMWCCPSTSCGGAGFKHDIWPTSRR